MIELNRRVREEIRSNPDNQPFFDALCRSRIDLFETIRTILNDAQQEKWDMWLAGLPGRCLGESPDPKSFGSVVELGTPEEDPVLRN